MRKSRTKCSLWCSHVCLVSSLWFSCGLAVSMGEAAKPLLFEGFQAGCHAVLRGKRGTYILTCLQTCRKSFYVDGTKLLRRFQKMNCIFRGRRSTLETSILILLGRAQHFKCVALRALHSTLHTLHFTLYTPHSTLYTPHSTLYNLHSTLYTPHSIHSTLHSLHSTLHTLHSTLFRIPQSTVHWYGNRGKNVQDCPNNLVHKSVLRDCIRVRGLHLAFPFLNAAGTTIPHVFQNWKNIKQLSSKIFGSSRRTNQETILKSEDQAAFLGMIHNLILHIKLPYFRGWIGWTSTKSQLFCCSLPGCWPLQIPLLALPIFLWLKMSQSPKASHSWVPKLINSLFDQSTFVSVRPQFLRWSVKHQQFSLLKPLLYVPSFVRAKSQFFAGFNSQATSLHLWRPDAAVSLLPTRCWAWLPCYHAVWRVKGITKIGAKNNNFMVIQWDKSGYKKWWPKSDPIRKNNGP